MGQLCFRLPIQQVGSHTSTLFISSLSCKLSDSLVFVSIMTYDISIYFALCTSVLHCLCLYTHIYVILTLRCIILRENHGPGELGSQRLLQSEDHSLPVLTCCFSPDSTKLATGSLDKTGRLWDLERNHSTVCVHQSIH